MRRQDKRLIAWVAALVLVQVFVSGWIIEAKAVTVNAHGGVHTKTARGPSADSLDSQRAAYEHDVCAESDGRLTVDMDPRHAVNLHDSPLRITTNGEGLVEESTFEYVRSLHLRDGQQVPTIVESMELVQRRHGCLLMELKSLNWTGDMIHWLQHKAARLGILKQFRLYLAWSPLVERARDFAPRLRVVWKMKTETDLPRIKGYGVWAVCPRWGGIYKNNVTRIHDIGVKVMAPVSKPERWLRIKRSGADLMMTNQPLRAARYFN